MNTPRLRVNLYDWPEKGSLAVCLMIADETSCQHTVGDAKTPFIFTPEDHKQYHAVRGLLRDFDIGYTW
jgi:hypothetical protein